MTHLSYYAFLMIHPKMDLNLSSYVGYSTNPSNDVNLHNTLTSVDTSRTGCAAPHWRLDMILGPFDSSELAIECSHEWATGVRGIAAKRQKANFLKDMYNVKLVRLTS